MKNYLVKIVCSAYVEAEEEEEAIEKAMDGDIVYSEESVKSVKQIPEMAVKW